MAARRHRETVRSRPGLRARTQRGTREHLPRRLDLPDRPLPRQGDGAEHPRAALRQRAVRADLEPQLRRPRADHDGRGHRRRGSGRVLRRHRRGARRHPEPPPAAARADGDGGTHLVRRDAPARGEGEGARRRLAPAGSVTGHRARTVRRRLAGRGEGHGVPRRGRHEPLLDDRDVRRDQARDQHATVGRCALLPPHGQAARAPRHRDRRRVQARAGAPVHADADLRAGAERPCDPRPAGRGGHDPVRIEGPGCRDAGARRHDGLRLRPRVHGGEPRGLRTAHPRRPPRRPAPVPAARGGRAELAHPRPRRAFLGRPGRPARAVLPGSWGPASADELLARDGRTWRRP